MPVPISLQGVSEGRVMKILSAVPMPIISLYCPMALVPHSSPHHELGATRNVRLDGKLSAPLAGEIRTGCAGAEGMQR